MSEGDNSEAPWDVIGSLYHLSFVNFHLAERVRAFLRYAFGSPSRRFRDDFTLFC